jgi:predicted transcriptional regulator
MMQAAKQQALESIRNLPDDADMDEIMYRLYVLDKILKGQEAAKQGRTVKAEDLRSEIDTW